MISRIRMVSIMLVASASLIGCTKSPAEPSTQPTVPSQQELQRYLKNQPKPDKPLRIVIVQDYSPSIKQQGVPNLQHTHIEMVLASLQSHGGEFAIGRICSNANTPLLRVTIVAPPRLRKEMLHNLPAPETYRKTLREQGVNSFAIRRKVTAYRLKYTQATEKDVRTLEQYQQQLKVWKQQTQTTIQAFRQKYKPWLKQGFTCAETDVVGGVKRADVFLRETAKNHDRKVALFITDGIHTKGGNSKLRWQSNAKVLLVSGAGNPGVFRTIPHNRFEAVESALRNSLSNHQPGGQSYE